MDISCRDRPASRPRARAWMATLALWPFLAPWASAPSRAGDVPIGREALLREGPGGWGALRAYSQHLEAAGVVTDGQIGEAAKTKPTTHERFRLLVNDPCFVLTYGPEEGPDRIKIAAGLNEDYGFHLRSTSADAPFALKYAGKETKDVLDHIDGHVLRYTNAAWSLLGKSLTDLVREPNFHLKEVSPVEEEGRRLARVSFDYNWSGKAGEAPMLGGWLLLWPEGHWSIQRHEVRLGRPGFGKPGLGESRMVGALGFGEQDGDFRKLKWVSERYYSTTSDAAAEGRCDFETWEHKTVPKSEFTLTAFGLPEVLPGGSRAVTPEKLSASGDPGAILIALGGLAAVIAVVLRVLANRRSARAGTA